jgi:hypothetical protein
MSIKIISEIPHPKVVKQAVCRGCGATLEYVPNDVILLWSGKDYSGGSDGAKGFKCPKCGKDVITERW